jgi:cell wall-associated NlpC family hydrolase
MAVDVEVEVMSFGRVTGSDLTGDLRRGAQRPTTGKMVRLRAVTLLLALVALAGCGATARPEASGHETAQIVATPKPKAANAIKKPAASGDSEAADAYPLPEGVNGVHEAPSPDAVPAAEKLKSTVSPGAPSDAQVRAELAEMERVLKKARRPRAGRRPARTKGGNVEVPEGVPDAVAAIFSGGNAIARFPYVYGGGHASFVDTAYDCSASVSYALAAAGLLNAPLTSGQLARWGAPGPGKWVTIYANAGHAFMVVAGLRFDTSGRSRAGTRWQVAPRSLAGFSVRHPAGL